MRLSLEIRVIETVKEGFQRDAQNYAAFDAVRGVLTKIEGKKVTKRILPSLQAALINAGVATAESTFSMGRPYTFSGLEIAWWGRGTRSKGFDQRSYLTLTKGSGVTNSADDSANLEFFRMNNGAMGTAALERNAQRTALLSDSAAIARLCFAGERYQGALKDITAALEFEGPFTADRYEIERIVKGEKS